MGLLSTYNIIEKHLLLIQNDFSNLSNKYVDSIKYARCDKEELKLKLKILSSYINILKCYYKFTYIYKFSFSSLNESASTFAGQITVNGTNILSLVSYIGTLTNVVSAIAIEFENNKQYDFDTIISGNDLYVYSHDGALFFSSTINQITISGGNVTITTTSVDESDFNIDNTINCLEIADVCKIIKSSYKILKQEDFISCGC